MGIIKLLLESGGDFNLKNKKDMLPINYTTRIAMASVIEQVANITKRKLLFANRIITHYSQRTNSHIQHLLSLQRK